MSEKKEVVFVVRIWFIKATIAISLEDIEAIASSARQGISNRESQFINDVIASVATEITIAQ